MRELRPGLWHWEAPHPQWESGGRGAEVSSYAIDDDERLLFFDRSPRRASSRSSQATARRHRPHCPWHERDSGGLVERSGAVYTRCPTPPRT